MWKITSATPHINKWLVILFIAVAFLLLGIWCILSMSTLPADNTDTQKSDVPKEDIAPLQFTSSAVPDEVRKKMQGVTISENSPVGFDDLSYLTLSYTGYDGKTHAGNMIVSAELADEVISIFKELYNIGFPIEKMRLPCEYDGVDENSMRDNNTSAFNDRPIEGTGGLSYHQLGRAIDINPLVNPYIRFSDGVVLPETAYKYLDRTLGKEGMIAEDSPCVEIFKKYGWDWGGDWKSVKDYQHFEKK